MRNIAEGFLFFLLSFSFFLASRNMVVRPLLQPRRMILDPFAKKIFLVRCSAFFFALVIRIGLSFEAIMYGQQGQVWRVLRLTA